MELFEDVANKNELEKACFKEREYRELVKQYAGQIMAGLKANPSVYTDQSDLWMIINAIEQAHALAKAVLESLDKEKV